MEGTNTGGRVGKQNQRRGVKAGWVRFYLEKLTFQPDMYFPAGRGGWSDMYIELKKPKRKMDKNGKQIRVAYELWKRNHLVYCCDSLYSTLEVIDWYHSLDLTPRSLERKDFKERTLDETPQSLTLVQDSKSEESKKRPLFDVIHLTSNDDNDNVKATKKKRLDEPVIDID
jgi:hypothetical protein